MITCKDTRNGSNNILKERKFDSNIKGYTKSDYNSKDFQVERTVKHLADYLFIPCCEVCQECHNKFYSLVMPSRFDVVTFQELDIPINFKDCKSIFNSEQLKDLHKLIFLDCLIKNMDRHSENIAVYYSRSEEKIIGLYPSFDTVESLTNSQSNNCLFGIDELKSYQHLEVLTYLLQYDYIKSMFKVFQAIDFSTWDISEEHQVWLAKRQELFKRYSEQTHEF